MHGNMRLLKKITWSLLAGILTSLSILAFGLVAAALVLFIHILFERVEPKALAVWSVSIVLAISFVSGSISWWRSYD